MNQPRSPIFVLTGTPGSGKTSVAQALLRRFPTGLHIPLDDLRAWVVSGQAPPVPVWTDETSRQFLLARHAAADVAGRYAAAGFAVALDDVIYPEEVRALFERPLAGFPLYNVLLHPPLQQAL